MLYNQSNIRNFCIIAHIDHGKSTLSDRLLELTATVDKRLMKNQILDQMDLERERGITIKLQPAAMKYRFANEDYLLNLIDTPGHIDFNYEVSRSLAAVEGAILLVDATQGIQAQTIGNLHLAREQGLTIIPVLNKIDMPNADINNHRLALAELLNVNASEVLLTSGKTGAGVKELLEAIVRRFPPPAVKDNSTVARALIFDSFYDDFLGVVAYIRVLSGSFQAGDEVVFLATAEETKLLEVGYLSPDRKKQSVLSLGTIGYVVSGLKNIGSVRVGDAMGHKSDGRPQPIAGWREIKPMVYASIFLKDGEDVNLLRDAFAKLRLNDAALVWQMEKSPVLGFGVRCGFLGLLHLEIIQQRLEREFNLETVVTVPSVAYEIVLTSGQRSIATSLIDWPEPSKIKEIREPWIKAEVICPNRFVGTVMQFLQNRHGIYLNTSYLARGSGEADSMAVLSYDFPLAVILVDFYDKLKSVSSGYASLNYELADYRPADVVRLDILIADKLQDELSMVVYRDEAHLAGKKVVNKLKELLPQQQFVVKLQASIGGKVVAAERLSALRKDVTAKLYGGDVSRKKKLLAKQKKGKKKMAEIGHGQIRVPSDVYLKLLKN